jgi:down-regulator of transcription 1
MVRLVQEILPPGIVMGKDTQDIMLECANEFIRLVTFQANEICARNSSNGFISLQHVIAACRELGFEEYVSEIEAVSADFERDLKAMQKVGAL